MAWNKPLPNIAEDMKPFWDGLREHKLLLLRCKVCGSWYWPLAFCRNHKNDPWGENMEWTEASGKGKVFVFNIHFRGFHPAFDAEVPYVFALIETKEGPLLGSNVIGCDPKQVYIGMPVEVVFEDIDDQFTLPKFRPIT